MSEAPRKIAVIVALDVAGYSARTEADEARATAEVAGLRGVIEGIAKRHAGRVFNTAGDGFMLEFGSSLAAVEAALALAEACEPKVRVGVHLGDVVVQPNGDLLGHGVNVAARLMAQAAPGSALVSADVRRTIRGPIAERLQSRGILKLDKMAETIEAFVVSAGTTAVASKSKLAEPMLAVLPFDNLSTDPELTFFSDGVSDELIQVLARQAKLKVIGRTSSFQFRGDKKAEAARTLKCSHILDGSIQRAHRRVRVAAHLVEVSSQTTLWSERYDRGLEDTFSVQDEIAASIAGALNRTFSRLPSVALDPDTYDLYLRTNRSAIAWEEIEANIAQLEEITARAPHFADAWGNLSAHRAHRRLFRPFVERDAIAGVASQEAARALRLDPNNPGALAAAFLLQPPTGRFIESEKAMDRLVEASHSDGLWHIFHVLQLESVGRMKDGIAVAQQAEDLNALDPHIANCVGQSLFFGGRFAEARRSLEATLRRWPDMHYSAFNLVLLSALAGDWATVDAMLAPSRLAKFPLRQFERVLVGTVAVLRDPSPDARRHPIDSARSYFDKTGRARLPALAFAAHCGAVDEACEIAAKAKIGPVGDPDDDMGIDAYRTHFLFHAGFPAFRCDPRFVRLCARLGLVEYWITTQHWPDCVSEVPYDFKAECEKARDIPKQEFGV